MLKKRLSKADYILVLISLVMLLIFIELYPQVFPDAGLRLKINQEQITGRAEKLLHDLGYDTDKFYFAPELLRDTNLSQHLQQRYGLEKTNNIARDNQLPVFYWRVKLKDIESDDRKLKISFGSEDEAKSYIDKMLSDTITVNLSTGGDVIGLNVRLGEDSAIDTLSYDHSLQLATDFFHKHITDTSAFRFSPKNDNHNTVKSIYGFRWERADSIYGNEQSVNIEVSGDKITKFKINFEPEKKPKKSKNLESIPTVILMVCVIIFMLILLIQKLRKDRIELKSNIAISVAVALSWVILMIINITRDSGDSNFLLVLILPIVITTPFILFSFIVSNSLGESEAREIWPDKLVTMDALRSGIVLFPKLSISLIRGFSLAFIVAGTVAVLLKAADLNFNFFIVTENDRLYAKLSYVPLLFVAASGILNVCFGEYVFRLFFLSYFRKKIGSTQIIILLAVLLWIFVFGSYLNFKLSSYGLTLAINFVLGLLIVFFFLKGDFLTVLWGGFAYYLLRELYPFFHFSEGPLWWNGVAMWIIFAVVFLIAMIGLRKNIDPGSFKKYVPEYQKRQQERERILRELEIARSVQASFLPRKNPRLSGVDVASLCIPATEVGGDYFDFIELYDGRLGVVIGDVSGKGISAAFHMTLTKGFLKSQAKTSLSPRQVLIHLNELFYENVERGTFISMIYGIFDLNNKKFTFARAGHNPLLLKKREQNNVEILCPKGLALGLEKGSLFNRLIEEYTVNIHSKDIFMFYTDGFSEAMNNKNEEFGEDRLQILLNKTISLSAESIITEIKSQIFNFVQKAPQHDDMTMIIVKVM